MSMKEAEKVSWYTYHACHVISLGGSRTSGCKRGGTGKGEGLTELDLGINTNYGGNEIGIVEHSTGYELFDTGRRNISA